MLSNQAFNRSIIVATVLLAAALVTARFTIHTLSAVAVDALICAVFGFAIVTYLLHQNILRSNAKSPQRFVAAFTGAIAVKLFACIIFLGVYIYMGGQQPVPVALITFCIYVVYNVLMIRSLLGVVRQK